MATRSVLPSPRRTQNSSDSIHLVFPASASDPASLSVFEDPPVAEVEKETFDLPSAIGSVIIRTTTPGLSIDLSSIQSRMTSGRAHARQDGRLVSLLVLGLMLASVFVLLRHSAKVTDYRTAAQATMSHYTTRLKQELPALGWWGPLYLYLIYLVTTVFMLPLWGFHMITGAVYGTFWSSLFITTTQATCAGAAFACSRYVLGPIIRTRLDAWYGRKYRAIDAAVGEQGLYITILLRLSPIIPFGMNNYVCGVTRIKLWEWVVGTWVGVLPGTTVYCYMGAVAGDMLGDAPVDPQAAQMQRILGVVGIVSGLAVVYIMNRMAVKALKDVGVTSEAMDDKVS